MLAAAALTAAEGLRAACAAGKQAATTASSTTAVPRRRLWLLSIVIDPLAPCWEQQERLEEPHDVAAVVPSSRETLRHADLAARGCACAHSRSWETGGMGSQHGVDND